MYKINTAIIQLFMRIMIENDLFLKISCLYFMWTKYLCFHFLNFCISFEVSVIFPCLKTKWRGTCFTFHMTNGTTPIFMYHSESKFYLMNMEYLESITIFPSVHQIFLELSSFQFSL